MVNAAKAKTNAIICIRASTSSQICISVCNLSTTPLQIMLDRGHAAVSIELCALAAFALNIGHF